MTEQLALPLDTPRRVKLTGSLFRPDVPDGAVNVTRQARKPFRQFANPHPVGKHCEVCWSGWIYDDSTPLAHDRKQAVERYTEELARNGDLKAQARKLLAGKDLACWCEPGQPCHADVLLVFANDARYTR